MVLTRSSIRCWSPSIWLRSPFTSCDPCSLCRQRTYLPWEVHSSGAFPRHLIERSDTANGLTQVHFSVKITRSTSTCERLFIVHLPTLPHRSTLDVRIPASLKSSGIGILESNNVNSLFPFEGVDRWRSKTNG
jgi:hypothetical protein